jgi:hypothetical protein
MAESDDEEAYDRKMVLNPDGTWRYGERIPPAPGARPFRNGLVKINWPADHIRLDQALSGYRSLAASILRRHCLDIDRCGEMTFGELSKLDESSTIEQDATEVNASEPAAHAECDDPEPEAFSRPPGTYTVREFADAITDITATDNEKIKEAKKQKAIIQKYWERKIGTHKPIVQAKGIRNVEYFDLEDLFNVATKQNIIFDRESVTTRLAGTVFG